MNRLIVSVAGMFFGWCAMMVACFIALLCGENIEVLGVLVLVGWYSIVVVAVAWLVVCMPCYMLIPAGSICFKWYVGGPIGAVVGALVGAVMIDQFAWFMILSGIVGGVAGATGHFLLKPGSVKDIEVHMNRKSLQGDL